MFGLFKRKTTTEKLHDKYKSLIKQAYNLSKSNRSAGCRRRRSIGTRARRRAGSRLPY